MRRFTLTAMAFMFVATACSKAAIPSSEVAPESTVLSLAEVDTRPEFLRCREPNVPPPGGIPGFERGRVYMSFVLGFDGKPEPSSIQTMRSGPFDTKARELLEGCEWTAAVNDGEPVRVRMRFVAYVDPNS